MEDDSCKRHDRYCHKRSWKETGGDPAYTCDPLLLDLYLCLLVKSFALRFLQVRSNPYNYRGNLRLGTGHELLKVSLAIERNLHQVTSVLLRSTSKWDQRSIWPCRVPLSSADRLLCHSWWCTAGMIRSSIHHQVNCYTNQLPAPIKRLRCTMACGMRSRLARPQNAWNSSSPTWWPGLNRGRWKL